MRTPPRIGVDTCWHALAIRPFVRLTCVSQCLRTFFRAERARMSKGSMARAAAARPNPAADSRWDCGTRARQRKPRKGSARPERRALAPRRAAAGA